MKLTNEDIILLQDAFFKEKGLVRQHLDSYNEFIEKGLQEVIDEVGEIVIESPENPYAIKFGKIMILKRSNSTKIITEPYITEADGTSHEIYPMEARFRNLSYVVPLSLEMTPVIGGHL